MRWLALLSAVALVGGAAAAAALTWSPGGFAGNPAAIKEGMSANQVRAVAGFPSSIGSVRLGMGEYQRRSTLELTQGGPPVLTGCWIYDVAPNPDSSLLGVTACFRNDRVLRVYDSVHG
jgi:hypothetical protein